MRQLLKRKTLDGSWTEFSFPMKSRFFKIKNFSGGDVYVSFDDDTEDDESFRIAAGTSDRVAICEEGSARNLFMVDAVWVKGSGEVEVVALDAFAENNPSYIASNEFVGGDGYEVSSNVLTVGKDASVGQHALIVQ